MGKRAFSGAVLALTLTTSVLCSTGAWAQAPRPSWGTERVLDCGAQQVIAYFTPGGVFTAFNVVDSTLVIVPKRVDVVFPDGSEATTLDVPGFHRNNASTVTCTYTDPRGLYITLMGLAA